MYLSQGYYRGMGQGPSTQQIVGTVYSAGAAVATPIIAGSGTVLAGALGAAAIPIVGAAFAGIFLGIQAILNSGCGQSCIITSNWANQAEDLLKKNVAAYLALPVPRAQSAQQAYLANFDSIWNYLVQECSQPGLSTAGRNCVADRQQGACKWKDSSGQCWNWFSGYRDPIAHDSNVVSDAQAAVAGASQAAGSLPLGLIAAAVLITVGVLVS